MKLPSITYLLASAKESFKRFYLPIISSVIVAIVAIYLIENSHSQTNALPYINLMLVFYLGIPLFFSTTLISESYGLQKKQTIGLQILAVLALVGLYFTFPNAESSQNTSLPYIKYALYNITAHLLVSFVAFIRNKQLNAFWNFNKILFIRFITSLLYSGFIYVGIILGLLALDLLFKVKIEGELYGELSVVIFSVFNTWFFVSDIPQKIKELEDVREYPKGLKIFTQYVLLPLLGLYILILYAYITKIVVKWDWPEGIVSYLIIGMSILGVFAFLLLHPYAQAKENSWIKKTTSWYYYILIPLLVVMFIAIFMRVNDYGITVNRYAIIVLGVWLTVVCVYTVFRKTNIKFIPISLASIAILISFGPWGMFSLSERSQVSRLHEILEQAKILKDNKVQNEVIWLTDSLPVIFPSKTENTNEGILSDSLHNEVMSILDYLDDHHGFSAIREWYSQDIKALMQTQYKIKEKYQRVGEAEMYMRSLGLEYDSRYASDEPEISFTVDKNTQITNVSGYDYFTGFSTYIYEGSDKTMHSFRIDSVEYTLEYTQKPKFQIILKSQGKDLMFDLQVLVDSLIKEYGENYSQSISESKMQIIGSLKNFDITIKLDNIELEKDTKNLELKRISGDLFLKRK